MKRPAHAPFFLITIAFILGIIFQVYCNVELWLITSVTIPVLIIILLFKNFTPLFRRVLFSISFFAFGSVCTHLNTSSNYSNNIKNLNGVTEFEGTVISDIKEKSKSNLILLEISKVKSENRWINATGKVLMYVNKEIECPVYGDEILVKSNLNEISPPNNPNQFHYKRYLKFKGVYNQTYLRDKSYVILGKNKGNAIVSKSIQLRNNCEAIIDSKFTSKREASIAKAMILGSRDDLDSALIKAYSGSGAMHVLAVSGLHVGIIYGLIQILLRLLPNTKKLKLFKTVFSLLMIWAFAFTTGLSMSVIRASIMFSVICIGNGFNKQSNILNTLSFCAFVMLLFNPYAIMEVGFQLSFCAVFGIIYLQPKIENLFHVRPWFLKQIWVITSVSLAAQLATFPISLLYFHQFPTLFLLSNLIVIPAAFIILAGGLMAFVLIIIEPVADFIFYIVEQITKFINETILFINRSDFTQLTGIDISILETWLIYGIIASCFIFIWDKNKSFLKIAFLQIIVIFIINGIETINQNQQSKLTVYDTRGHSTVDLISGMDHTFIADSGFYNNEPAMLFNIKHNWWNNNLVDIGHKKLVKNIQLFKINKKIIAHINSDKGIQVISKSKIKPNFLIIANNCLKDLSLLKSIDNDVRIIFDSSNSYYNSLKLKKQNESTGLSCHFVNLENSFTTNL